MSNISKQIKTEASVHMAAAAVDSVPGLEEASEVALKQAPAEAPAGETLRERKVVKEKREEREKKGVNKEEAANLKAVLVAVRAVVPVVVLEEEPV